MTSLLDELRGLSSVACDTLNADVASKFGPFVDCTSNQAIAYSELSRVNGDGKLVYERLIYESIEVAHWMFGKQSDATLEELAVELMMVNLALLIAPHTTGCLHIQTNPKLAYSTSKTIKNAERIHSNFSHLSPSTSPTRICMKIPATYEGLAACRFLEQRGITTLATTLFSLEQAVLAADSGCRYVAPYVNELKVHFEPGYVDPTRADSLLLCGLIQEYFSRLGAQRGRPVKTEVMAASFTNVEEVMQLAGIRNVTVSPGLLEQLAGTRAEGWTGATVGMVERFAGGLEDEGRARGLERLVMEGDEAGWRMAFTRCEEGRAEGKLIQALNIFADVQERLEEVVRRGVKQGASPHHHPSVQMPNELMGCS
ncbi:putative transaldolase [Triangularia verruculosa]|uniref:Transaldolase n=1 Tax=Triangularia verruculosa TaxID=2587418 RepID=A0AAN6XF02_9PEZI|nr:putative transaldolase [Triangularia verruculosa]